MKILKLKTKILLVAMAVFLGVNSSVVFAFGAYGLNTVAGHSTVLRTSNLTPNTDVVFVVRKPNGAVIDISARTNQNGVALKELSDYHTREAGKYAVSVKGNNLSSEVFNYFDVYANRVSEYKSYFGPSDQVVSSLGGRARLKVRLVDDYNNPVEGHTVKLISSVTGGNIVPLSSSGKTNSLGELEFEVQSNNRGKVTYSAYDANSDLTLESKARIVYLSSGSNDLSSQLFTSVLSGVGNASGVVDRLEFVNPPGSVGRGENISLTLGAFDFQGQKVVNYSGTVRFAVTGDNSGYANLPGDYQFVLANQGEHTFSLGFTFLNDGVYELQVIDINNPSVRGELSLVVSSGGGVVLDGGIVVNNPLSGGTYSNNVQVISGTAPPASNLRIFDNNIKIGDVVASALGEFSFTTGRLADGDHEIYVASVNEIGTIVETSSVITFSINTTPAEILGVEVEPSGQIGAGEIIKIKLTPSEKLSSVSMVLAGNLYVLVENDIGVYEVSVPAPIEFGEYTLTFTLKDQLGNESTFRDAHSFNVGPSAPVAAEKIGPVLDLKVTPGDRRVTLEWSPPAVGASKIDHYRVFYGSSPNELINAVDTFTNSTTWYVPNLVNGEIYYFAVAGVDAHGAMSESFESILYSTPVPLVAEMPSLEDEMGLGGADALEEMEKDASDSGPEILWLIFLSALGGIFYSRKGKFRDLLYVFGRKE